MVRRFVAAVIAIAFVAGCSSQSPQPGPSDSAPHSSAQSPGASGVVKGGIFTDPPNPRDLQPTLDAAAASSGLIGWEGGTIEASGPSGATYRLEIPPEALPVATTITMTPLSDITGFGSLDPGLEHKLGVELEPEGLQLIVPAQLRMSSQVSMPDGGVATGSYLGHGSDAGLVLAKQSGSTVSIEIPHFSGYWSVWPLQMEDWRVLANDRQAFVERTLDAAVANLIGVRRLEEMLGTAEPQSFDDLVRGLLRDFEKLVLRKRLKLAKNGCPEAQFAISAFLAYDRQLQLLGIADNEKLYAELSRPIPPDLLTLAWNLCLDEEYQRCAAIGEWPRLASFLLGQVRQRALWGKPLTEQQMQDGTDRLKRCGHWRVKLNTSEVFTIPGAGGEDAELTREIDVRFKADGDGPFGLGGLSIGDGEADVQVNKLDWYWTASTETNFQTGIPAQARINGMTFKIPKDKIEPVAVSLNLWLNPGSVTFDSIIGDNVEHEEATWWNSSQLVFGQSGAPTIKDGWQFRTRPYKAVFAKDGSGGQTGGTLQSRIEVIVEHTPD